MSRPKPNILLEYVNKKTYRTEQVLQARAIWAVFYQNKPFNLKSANILTNYPGPKYKKVSFSNPGHAHNLAKKLNDMFNTTEFEVVELVEGQIVKEEEQTATAGDVAKLAFQRGYNVAARVHVYLFGNAIGT